jgi:hypothetical protein
MSARSVTAVAAAVALGAAPATMAKDRDSSSARDGGPPTIDIQKTCREDTDALRAVQGSAQDMGVCLSDEREARQQLVKEWTRYPALIKSQCVQTSEYPPGYVEWLSCIQMMRDVLQLPKQEALQHPRGGRPAPIARSSGWSLLEQRVPGGQVHRERPSPTANSIAVTDSGRRPRELEINRPRRRCRATQLRCQGQG